jgi:cell division protein FtsB
MVYRLDDNGDAGGSTVRGIMVLAALLMVTIGLTCTRHRTDWLYTKQQADYEAVQRENTDLRIQVEKLKFQSEFLEQQKKGTVNNE